MLLVSVFIYRIRFLEIVRILDLIFDLVYPKDWVQTRFEVCCAIAQRNATVWTYSRRSSSRGIFGWTQRFQFIQSQTRVHSYFVWWRKSLESERLVDHFNPLFLLICSISVCFVLPLFNFVLPLFNQNPPCFCFIAVRIEPTVNSLGNDPGYIILQIFLLIWLFWEITENLCQNLAPLPRNLHRFD